VVAGVVHLIQLRSLARRKVNFHEPVSEAATTLRSALLISECAAGLSNLYITLPAAAAPIATPVRLFIVLNSRCLLLAFVGQKV
jgi:hypothetical protein